MKKVTVIGLFCTGKEVSDGQSIKTRIVTQELEKVFGTENVRRIDTHGWKKAPLKLFTRCILSVRDSQNVIFMTDDGGIKVFPWLLRLPNIFYKRNLHYIVIGGWLGQFLKEHRFLANCLKKIDHIFAETSVMQEDLQAMGFSNVHLLPNFKNLTPLKEEQLVVDHKEPYRFCTFSRVMREKGIQDAAEAIKSLNEKYGRTVCTLDIYGAVDPGQTQWFDEISANFPQAVRYRGVAPFDQSVNVLKDYFALLFPTSYTKEGIPGTIIDAYAAGVPVIASKWIGFRDMIEDGRTGLGYPWLENERLGEVIESAVTEPRNILGMKENCLKKAESYIPENLIKILLQEMS